MKSPLVIHNIQDEYPNLEWLIPSLFEIALVSLNGVVVP